MQRGATGAEDGSRGRKPLFPPGWEGRHEGKVEVCTEAGEGDSVALSGARGREGPLF